jgi:hypothetical protein
MRSVLIGYMVKQRLTRAGWISPWADHPDCGFPCGPPVEEICSVSHCMARNYGDPADSGAENPFCLFDDPEVAWGMVPSEDRGRAALFAYRLWPIQFEEGNQEEIDLWWEPALRPLPDTFACLGWDAVVGGNQHCFGCSPLSCNSGSDLVRCPELNRYCLVDDRQTALELAQRFSISQPEPGPYCAVQVWRELWTVE